MNYNIDLILELDPAEFLHELRTVGAIATPALDETTRQHLLGTALSYPYQQEERVVGPYRVHQEMASCTTFPSDSPFHALRDRLETKIHDILGTLEPPPLRDPLHFDHLVLQRYPPGSLGITPHRDGKKFINLICIFVLQGHAAFAVCDDRQGHNPKALEASPGNLILMRAPGFLGETIRPFHYVSHVTSERLTFSLRQRKSSP